MKSYRVMVIELSFLGLQEPALGYTVFYHPITGYFSHLLSDVKLSQCFTVKGAGRRMGEASTGPACPYQIHPKSTAEDGRACSCCTCRYWWRWWISNWSRFCGFCTNNNWNEACWFPLYFVSHTFLHITCSCLYTFSMYFIFEGSQVLRNPFFGLPGITPPSLTDSMIGSVP